MIDLQLLKAELSKPEYATLIANGYHAAIADSLNNDTVQVVKSIAIGDLNSFMDRNGFTLAVKSAYATTNDTTLKGACAAVLDVLSARYTHVDLTLDRVNTVLSILVSNNVITSQDKDNILALKNVTVSLAEALFGVKVSHIDVANALKG